MILQFKSTKYAWGNDFHILDEDGNRKFKVRSSTLLWVKKLEVFDLEKNHLITIKKDPKSLVKKKFDIHIDGYQDVSITKELSIIPKYIFEGLEWDMNGIMLHDYQMFHNGQMILSIREKENPDWGIRPILEIFDPVEELMALAVVLTISYAMPAKDA